MIVGAEGEAERDYDFLASLEVVILDQADVILMQVNLLLYVMRFYAYSKSHLFFCLFLQNWDHLLHIWDHFHLQPRESHGTDFSRVRPWAVNGWSKHYRQTAIFSSIALLEFSSLLNKRCCNYAGSVRVVNPIANGSICQVVVQLPQVYTTLNRSSSSNLSKWKTMIKCFFFFSFFQVFQRLDAPSVTQGLDVRFDFLVRKVLPDHTDPLMAHTMIYVPSYFDFVRIRNYLRKQGLSFVQICEYSKVKKPALTFVFCFYFIHS